MTASPKHLGKYELQMRLGQGGMAEVWKGFDPQLRRSVAIKFLHANLRSHPDFTNRFVREGQAIAALHHPNIVQVYDFQVSAAEDENPMAYMVMDYIEGSTLADYLQQTSYAGNAPSPYEIVRLFASISLAIDYAHQQHMIHRDIKPANILLDTRNTAHNPMGEPILTDFGIVKMLGTAAITSTGVSMGTPLYISPEQVHGKSGNEQSDIYALGVILYEMCTGQPPYSGDNPYVILAQRISRPPDPPSLHNPDISSAVDAVILRCLAMEPEERFASGCQLTAALAEAFELPVPDPVRHTLSLPPSQGKTPSSPLANHTLPIITTSPIVSSTDPQIEPMRNSPSLPLITGNDTLLSDTGATIASALEKQELAVLHAPKKEDIDLPAQAPSTPEKEHSDLPAQAPSTGPMTPPPFPTHRYRLTPSRIILLLVLIGVSVGTYAFLHQAPDTTSLPGSAPVGNATFVSSEQQNGQNTPALNDGIDVHLYSVHDPAPGHRYYAWLQENLGDTSSIPLGALHIDQGNATLSYIDSQHRNLLALTSNLLVTEEPTSIIPDPPSHDRTQWRYVATIPHTSTSTNKLSYLDHVRHLLVSEPRLERLQLHNGLDFQLMNTLQDIYIQILEMRGTSALQATRLHLANILSALDGPCVQQELEDTPSSKSLQDTPIVVAYKASILGCTHTSGSHGYIAHIMHDLNGMSNAPDALPQQVQRAKQIQQNLTAIRGELEQIHTEALQLAHLDDAHLMQSQTLLNTLAFQADDVMGGRFDPTRQALLPGMVQINHEITFLADFTVFPYKIG